MRRMLSIVFLAICLFAVTLTPARSATGQRDNWGAIAYSFRTGRWGLVYNYPTQAQAVNSAVARCGTRDCQAVVWFRNGCGAFAKGRTAYGWGIGETRAEAEGKALAACRQRGPNCRLVSWACTSR